VRFSATERRQNLDRLESETFDVVVVGGGITGAGVALDAATRGLRTALVERGDFASGTSSRSSKLVHGGLRYLNQREFRLVYEALAERQRLLRLAPHLVRPLPFLIPVFGTGGADKAKARALAGALSAALWMYDATGGARIGKLHRRLSRAETIAHMPDLDPDRLAAGFLYYDARVDDARLTLAVTKTAASAGAVVANHLEATGLVPSDGKVGGAELHDRLDGRRLAVRAGAVVNAAGVWADDLRALDEGRHPGTIRPAKGVHITLPAGRVRLDVAAVLPVPRDRRSIFVIPWGDRVYAGTTDTDYQGPLDTPTCTGEEVAYLLGALNAWLVLERPLGPGDVLGTWAGLRPLVGGAASARTADLSRRHVVRVSESGMVTVVGGKLTTYRRMAADTVDTVLTVLGRGRRAPRSRTGAVPIFGAEGYEAMAEPEAAARLGVDPETLAHLAGRYGGHARAVAAMVAEDAGLGRPLVDGLPYLQAEAVYAARYEMAMTLEDVLSRRTRALLLDREATAAAAPSVTELIAPELGWDGSECARQVEAFAAVVEREREAATSTSGPGPSIDAAEAAIEAQLLAGTDGPATPCAEALG
jgi:glycerol-3-phosphate dehydrogenase